MRYTAAAIACGLALKAATAHAEDVRRFRINGFLLEVTVQQTAVPEDPYAPRRIMVSASTGEGIRFGAELETYDHVADAWATDLDANGHPEAVIWMQAMGSGSYGDLIFMDISPGGIALRELPPLRSSEQRGYAGHDRFHVQNQRIIRSFPIYRDADANCCPSGGRAEITYSYNGARLDR